MLWQRQANENVSSVLDIDSIDSNQGSGRPQQCGLARMDSQETTRGPSQPNGDRDRGVPPAITCRVHAIQSSSGTELRLLLRRADQFWTADLRKNEADSRLFDTAQLLTPETLVSIYGNIENPNDERENRDAKPRTITDISALTILSRAKPDLPKMTLLHGGPGESTGVLATSGPALQARLDNRILDARVSASASVVKLFSLVFELAVEYLSSQDFYRIHTPALIGWEFPGDEHEQFSLNYFDRETAWLAQTGDVHLQMALAADLERVYDVHTVFRREEHVDNRHLTEVNTRESASMLSSTDA